MKHIFHLADDFIGANDGNIVFHSEDPSEKLRSQSNWNIYDNASSGGIVVGVDNDMLRKYAYRTTGEKFSVHPSSGVSFEGITIPGIRNAEELVKQLAPTFPHHRLISWDICIDEEERPVLIELNMHHGQLDFHQMANGPLFGDRTREMLDEVFGK